VNILQGDIVKIENIKLPSIVVSTDFFNASGSVVCCPIYKNTFPDPLHIRIESDSIEGVAVCEQLRVIDLKQRGHKIVGSVKLENRMDISDAVQSIFDYI